MGANNESCSLKQVLHKAFKIPPKQWAKVILSSDPIYRWLGSEDKNKAIKVSLAAGKKEAQRIRRVYSYATPRQISREMGVNIKYFSVNSKCSYIPLAEYHSQPPIIAVNNELLNNIAELVSQENLYPHLRRDDIEEVLLAHELYHHLENIHPIMELSTLKFDTWRLGWIQLRSGLVTAREIAAFSFAQELMQLEYYPQALEFLVVYLRDKTTFPGYVNRFNTLVVGEFDNND